MGLGLPQTPWRLIRIDPPVEVFEAQFLPEEYSEDVATEWGEVKIPRREEPILQWLAGAAETATFTARFFDTGGFSANAATAQGLNALGVRSLRQPPASTDGILSRNVARDVAALRKAIRRDPKLGRPPRFTFEWGESVRYDCVIQSLGGVKYGEMWRFGQIRDVTFQITLRKIGADFDLERVDPTAKPHDSLHKAMPQGGTYEALAAREYGSPTIGVFLRQRNTAAFPRPGELVRLPAVDRFTRLRREPQAFALSEDPRAAAARLAAIDDRTGSREMPFLT